MGVFFRGASLWPLTSDGTNVTLASGQFNLPAGTAAAPSLLWTEVGLYHVDTNRLGVAGNSGKTPFTFDALPSPAFKLAGNASISWTNNLLGESTGAVDTGFKRAAAGWIQPTDGSTGGGNISLLAGAGIGIISNNTLSFGDQTTTTARFDFGAGAAVSITSGSASQMRSLGTFTPPSGSASWAALHLNPTINGTSSGTAYGLVVASKTNVLTGGTIKLLSLGTTTTDAFTGYTPVFDIDTAGLITTGNGLNVAAGAKVYWTGRGRIYSPADGTHLLTNAIETDFTRLILGTNNTSGVAIVKDGAYLQLRLGDGSAVTGAVTASLPVAAAARDGIIAFDTTLNALVYYVGGARYKLVGTAF